jgi:hypothetical protein
LILEREHFPRFHVGESLIPYGNDIFSAIGVWEKMQQANFMPKLGAEFVLGNSKATVSILFARYLARRYALLNLRLWAFYGVCALQKRFPLVPRLDFAEPAP